MPWFVSVLPHLAAAVTLVSALVALAYYLERIKDDPKFCAFRESLGHWLTSLPEKSFSSRVSGANELFFHWFDAFFYGKGTLLERGLWLGLIFSPVMLLLIRLLFLVAGEPMPQASHMLFLAMTLAFELSIVVVAATALKALAERLFGVPSEGLALGLSLAVGVILGGVGLQLLRFHLPVHPLRSLALSLLTVFILGVIMREASVSFYHLLLQDGPVA